MIGELLDLKTSAEHRQSLNELLEHHLGEIPCTGADSFSPVPVVIKSFYLPQMEQLCLVLHQALVKIVNAYFTDERIRSIYHLDVELENILKLAETKLYEPGCYRPDFLQSVDGQSKICEIGARYPINGWMISYYLNVMNKAKLGIPLDELEDVPQQTDFLEAIYARFKAESPLVLLHENEKGTEVFYLLEEFKKRGLESIAATPQELSLENGLLSLHGRPVDQFILEMDREELRKFPREILEQIVLNSNHFNDVRTLILVHDKRILAVLYDENIMNDYLSAAEYQFLRQFLIPTFALNSAEKRAEVRDSTQNWLLKKNSGGRGIGIYVKSECTAATWEKVLEEEWEDYMVQQHVTQQLFDYSDSAIANQINLVGMLLCYNDHSYGPGLFRGSAESVVNVHQGRGVIFPPMVFKS